MGVKRRYGDVERCVRGQGRSLTLAIWGENKGVGSRIDVCFRISGRSPSRAWTVYFAIRRSGGRTVRGAIGLTRIG
jgi:hypothetical protein